MGGQPGVDVAGPWSSRGSSEVSPTPGWALSSIRGADLKFVPVQKRSQGCKRVLERAPGWVKGGFDDSPKTWLILCAARSPKL